MATSNKPKKTTTTTTITKTVTTTTGTKRKKSTGISWSRLLGISQLKSKISRKTGIPLTKAGRERKIGSLVEKGIANVVGKGKEKAGCMIFFFIPTIVVAGVWYFI